MGCRAPDTEAHRLPLYSLTLSRQHRTYGSSKMPGHTLLLLCRTAPLAATDLGTCRMRRLHHLQKFVPNLREHHRLSVFPSNRW